MATTVLQTLSKSQSHPLVGRWFFTGMALAMIATSLAGFAPAIVDPTGRRAPLSLLAAAHGIAFLAWLMLYLAQSLLVATRHVAWHRRLGITSVVLLALMIPLGYLTSTALVRRGFDLSGDLRIAPEPRAGFLDPYTASVFTLGDLLLFATLASAGICYRHRAEIHKRLMLYANISLMGAPITHLIGHTPKLAPLLRPGMVMIPMSMFLLSGVVRDYLVARRIHPLTVGLAASLFASGPLRALLIGPSATWHGIVRWLSQ